MENLIGKADANSTVNIQADNGSHIIAPELISNTITGDVNISITHNASGIHPSPVVDPDAVLKSSDEYKRWIQREYEFVTEYNSLPGEDVLLSERYIQPLIVMRHKEKNERTQELCFEGKIYQQLISSKNYVEKEKSVLDVLFSEDTKGTCPGAVILQGNSGKGKSFTTRKIMLDWASGNLDRENFDLVFHLKCKEMNQISEDQSFVEILSINSNLTPDEILQVLQKPQHRVLVLIDGFDELKSSYSEPSITPIPKSLSEKALPEASLRALLKGYILRESFLLVTTRSTTTDTFKDLLKKPQRFTEIMGFSEREVEKYFEKFFHDEELFRKAFNAVKANETVLNACSSPVICWIICTVIREKIKKGADISHNLQTTTSIYVDFVSTLLEHHCQGLNESVPTLLKSLGQLAEREISEQQVLFDEKSVNKTVSDTAAGLFLCKSFFKKRTRQETMYSFMHLSFQEFFTALYYISLDKKEFHSNLKEKLHYQQKSIEYIGLDGQIKINGPLFNFNSVIVFLCGLCNEETCTILMETLNLRVRKFVRVHLEEWIIQNSVNRLRIRFILLCLYELHKKKVVKEVFKTWQEIDMSDGTLSGTECLALVYCLTCSGYSRSLTFSFAAEELKMLQPVLFRTSEEKLTVENFKDTDVTDLISALGEGKLLGELRLVPNLLNSSGLSDQSVLQILNALPKLKTMERLEITVKNISADTALNLTDFIQNAVNWKCISLMMSEACDDEKSLCSGLRFSSTDENLQLEMEWGYTRQRSPSLWGIMLEYPRSEMSSLNLKNLLQTFHDINCLTSESDDYTQQLDSLLADLSSVSGLTKITFTAPSLTEKWASRILFLFQHCKSLSKLSVTTNMACGDKTSLCSLLKLSCTDENLTLEIEWWCSDTYNIPPLSDISVKYPRSEMSSMNLKYLLQTFNDINCLQRDTDQCIDSLESHLSSVSGLTEMTLTACRLTEKWASRMLRLIQSCKSLTKLCFRAGFGICEISFDGNAGFLTEEGIRLLKESSKHHQCTLELTGLKCEKSTNACTYKPIDMDVLCGECDHPYVSIKTSGENWTEEVS